MALRVASAALGTVLGIALVGAALVALDGALLLEDFAAARANATSWHDPNTRFDPELGWAPIPSRRVELDWGTIETDEHGYRSPPLRPGSARIAVLGDSVAWGFGVDGDAAFPARLSRALAPFGVDVANLAVSGYGLDQTWLWFARQREALPALRHVVLALCARNDVADTQSNARYGRRKPLFRRARTGEASDDGIVLDDGPIRRHSLRHWYADSRFLRGALARVPALDAFVRARLGDVLLDRAETDAVIGALLARIDRETRARGGELHVVLLPARDDLDGEGDDYRLLRARTLSARLPLVEVLARLRAATLGGARSQAVFLDAMHLRARGHAIVARALLDHLAAVDPALAPDARTRARSQTTSPPPRASGGP
ncbi:MAG: hypothetical protein R3E88_10475 [Myxococcota bacterium]